MRYYLNKEPAKKSQRSMIFAGANSISGSFQITLRDTDDRDGRSEHGLRDTRPRETTPPDDDRRESNRSGFHGVWGAPDDDRGAGAADEKPPILKHQPGARDHAHTRGVVVTRRVC